MIMWAIGHRNLANIALVAAFVILSVATFQSVRSYVSLRDIKVDDYSTTVRWTRAVEPGGTFHIERYVHDEPNHGCQTHISRWWQSANDIGRKIILPSSTRATVQQGQMRDTSQTAPMEEGYWLYMARFEFVGCSMLNWLFGPPHFQTPALLVEVRAAD